MPAAQVVQPALAYLMTVNNAPPTMATAPTIRRPRVSARRPPASTPIPAGVFVAIAALMFVWAVLVPGREKQAVIPGALQPAE